MSDAAHTARTSTSREVEGERASELHAQVRDTAAVSNEGLDDAPIVSTGLHTSRCVAAQCSSRWAAQQ
jgi:hypothetical protein